MKQLIKYWPENAAKIKKSLSGATFIQLKSSLTWSVAKNQSKNTEIELLDSVFDRYASEINITIEANFIKNYAISKRDRLCAWCRKTG